MLLARQELERLPATVLREDFLEPQARLTLNLLERSFQPEQATPLVGTGRVWVALTSEIQIIALGAGGDGRSVGDKEWQVGVARKLKQRPEVEVPLGMLFQHPWHRREFGSHLTNVIRAMTLEAFGYQVTVTELTGWEHSLKNELILGRRVHRENRPARAKLEALLSSFGVQPKLTRLLGVEPANPAP